MFDVGKANARDIKIDVEGGSLKVSFDYSNQKYSNVFLTGPAEFVFQGKIAI
jgi:diaminopimelate epimerase